MNGYLLACVGCMGRTGDLTPQTTTEFDPATNTALVESFDERQAWVAAHVAEHQHDPGEIEIMLVAPPADPE